MTYIHVDTNKQNVYTCIDIGGKMMTTKIASLTVQKWGNSLAVRIPSIIAKSAHFQQGTPVELEVHEGVLIVKQMGKPKLSLEERLNMFDPKKHGGEEMAVESIGKEKF